MQSFLETGDATKLKKFVGYAMEECNGADLLEAVRIAILADDALDTLFTGLVAIISCATRKRVAHGTVKLDLEVRPWNMTQNEMLGVLSFCYD